MAWSKCGESGYVLQTPTTSSFSVIAAICDSNVELVAISNLKTNGAVFHEFVRLLSKEVDCRYKELKDRIVVTFDGERYHWVKKVEQQ